MVFGVFGLPPWNGWSCNSTTTNKAEPEDRPAGWWISLVKSYHSLLYPSFLTSPFFHIILWHHSISYSQNNSLLVIDIQEQYLQHSKLYYIIPYHSIFSRFCYIIPYYLILSIYGPIQSPIVPIYIYKQSYAHDFPVMIPSPHEIGPGRPGLELLAARSTANSAMCLGTGSKRRRRRKSGSVGARVVVCRLKPCPIKMSIS